MHKFKHARVWGAVVCPTTTRYDGDGDDDDNDDYDVDDLTAELGPQRIATSL